MKRSNLCQDCFCLFSYEVKPGRPPARCGDCRTIHLENLATAKVTEKTNKCAACGNDFTYQPKRGPAPKWCPKCKEEDSLTINQIHRKSRQELHEVRDSARIRVDNLEMLLRSRGTHISQNQSPGILSNP